MKTTERKMLQHWDGDPTHKYLENPRQYGSRCGELGLKPAEKKLEKNADFILGLKEGREMRKPSIIKNVRSRMQHIRYYNILALPHLIEMRKEIQLLHSYACEEARRADRYYRAAAHCGDCTPRGNRYLKEADNAENIYENDYSELSTKYEKEVKRLMLEQKITLSIRYG